jgi:hypothetical protein
MDSDKFSITSTQYPPNKHKLLSPRQRRKTSNLQNRGRSKTKKEINFISNKALQNDIFDKVIKIIDNKSLNITDRNIINPNSKFIVITYWWGRGNININTQIPCKNLHHLNYHWILKDGQKLKENPVHFEKMIDDWENCCIKQNCNFFSQEYPEFAEPGGYQLAINAKPLFIKKVLDTLASIGRQDLAILYIDGDMTINKYPHIFDMDNVDFMCRGWNIDPRGGRNYKNYPTFDPFTFETSGGIMYFANNIYARQILNLWIKWTSLKKFEGKADDRILSMLINAKKLYIDYNILQLPIEYLWLSEAYTPIDKTLKYLDNKDFRYKSILVEHPACLTLEEVARDQGAAQNREPKYYNSLVYADLEEQVEGGLLYEFIIFDNAKQANEFKMYLKFISKVSYYYSDGEEFSPYYIVKYNNIYGDVLNTFLIDNTDNIKLIINSLKKIDFLKHDSVIIQVSNNISSIKDIPYSIVNNNLTLYDDKLAINFIIALLTLKKNVIFIPKNTKNINLLKTINEKSKYYEFIANVNNENYQYPLIDNNSILYFSHNSTKLIKLLRISSNIEDFIKNFKRCVLHIQLIRCLFIMDFTTKKTIKSLNNSLSPKKTKFLLTNNEIKSLNNSYTYKKISQFNILSSII